MKKVNYFFLAFLTILLITTIINVAIEVRNPLRKSNEQIRAMLFEIFPTGSEMDYTIRKIKDSYKNWTIRTISNDHGYGIDSNGIPAENGAICVGEKYIRVHLGEYFNPFETSVVVFLGFDRHSKLIEVSVRKDTDSF